MIAEVKLLIETEATPAEINTWLPTIIQNDLPAKVAIVRVTSTEMTWQDWAERMIDRELGRQQAGTSSEEAEITELDEEATA